MASKMKFMLVFRQEIFNLANQQGKLNNEIIIGPEIRNPNLGSMV